MEIAEAVEKAKQALELAEKATPGPWAWGLSDFGTHQCRDVSTKWRSDAHLNGDDIDDCPTVAAHLHDEDSEFIAASRQLIPELAQAVIELAELLGRYKAAFDELPKTGD